MGALVGALGNLGQQLRAGWQQVRPAYRMAIAGVSVALFAALVILGIRVGNPDYVPLYANMEAADAAEVVQALREAGVSYRLAENGTAILVPKESVYQVRLDMAAKGLPRNGVVGFEIFQEFSFGSTDFERNVKYTWALQGELTRTIRSLAEVEDARVHVALPDKSLFLRDQARPSASVMLQLRPGARLSTKQVNGIAYLVARSVQSLQPEDVTIIDNYGNELSQPNDPEIAAGDAAMQRLEIQRLYERDLEQRLTSMLEPVYGHGRALVRVKADISFDSEEETREVFAEAAPGGLVRSSKTEEETSGTSTTTGGAGGALSGYTAPAAGAGNTNAYQRRAAEVDYEVNRTEHRRVVPPGRIVGLSVAVWIDGDLSQEEKDQVQATVAAAVSGGAQRQNIITVESMPFRSRAEQESPQATEPGRPGIMGLPNSLAAWIGAGALLGLLLAGVAMTMRLRRAPQPVQSAAPEMAAAAEVPAPAQPQSEAVSQRKDIERLARERPQEFVSFIRVWLAEE